MQSPSFVQFKDLLRRRAWDDAVSLARREADSGGPGEAFWYTQQAVALNRKKSWNEAQAAAEKSLTLKPHNPWALLALGDALLGRRRLKEAIEVLEEAAADRDERAAQRARERLCEALARTKQWERLRSCAAGGQLPPSRRIRFQAMAASGLGHHREAVGLCREALSGEPDNKEILWLMTEAEIAIEGLEPVRVRMGRLARIPSRPPIYGRIYASLCRRAGVHDDAIRQYESLRTREGGADATQKKAFLLAKSGKEKEAIPLLEELIRSDIANFVQHNAYIGACARAAELHRAEAFYTELQSLHPEHRPLYGRLRDVRKRMERSA